MKGGYVLTNIFDQAHYGIRPDMNEFGLLDGIDLSKRTLNEIEYQETIRKIIDMLYNFWELQRGDNEEWGELKCGSVAEMLLGHFIEKNKEFIEKKLINMMWTTVRKERDV